jgi:hypothetical protein
MKYIVSLLSIVLFSLTLHAQIEKVIVEKYYVSDAADATDTTGGILPVGSTTYRVFIDLLPGYTLLSLYGDENHKLLFSSDSVFFNNKVDGKSLAKDFNKTRYGENTVALDSWLTLGQVTKTATKTYFGIPKIDDKNGSFVGGTNNDGGSAGIANGLLTNNNASVGIPVTIADGLTIFDSIPTNWYSNGFADIVTGIDSTIFGSIVPGKMFESNYCEVSNSGIIGVDADSNQILIAQLTTKGSLSFELNVLLKDSSGNEMKYVAIDNGKLSEKEQLSPYLSYPLQCGCTDRNFIEYNKKYGCSDIAQCITPIVVGCMDPQACNFNPKANRAMPSMCCYPGYCNDRDLSIVCPALNAQALIYLYPNPSHDKITLKIDALKNQNVHYTISNATGTVVLDKDLGVVFEHVFEMIDVNSFQAGLYNCEIIVGETTKTIRFVKE